MSLVVPVVLTCTPLARQIPILAPATRKFCMLSAVLAWHAPYSVSRPIGVQRPRPSRGRPGMSERAQFLGGATISRSLIGEGCGLAEFLLSRASDAPLLGAGSDVECKQTGTDLWECQMPQIGMIGFTVKPVLTVLLERSGTSSLCIRVESAQIYLLYPGASNAQLLQGCVIDSANKVTWSASEGGWLLTTDLELRVGVELPRTFLLPRASVERPASAILRQFCAMQCNQFLLSLEQSYKAWARTQDLGLAPSSLAGAPTLRAVD